MTNAWLDEWLTDDLRVRGWDHTGPSAPEWPTGVHAAVEVAIPLTGGLSYRIGHRTVEVRPGYAIVLPAQHEHRTTAMPRTRARSFWIGECCARDGEAALGVRLEDAMVRPTDGLETLTNLLFDEAQKPGLGAARLADGVAAAMIVELLRRGTPDRFGDADPRIRRAIDRIESDFADNLGVDDLAGVAGLSRFHFTRLFKQTTTMSPYRYITDRRLRAAATLLERPHRSVTEVALSVGFADLGRFASAFRRAMGTSPSAYAARFADRSARIA